jgi:hypothetical protein
MIMLELVREKKENHKSVENGEREKGRKGDRKKHRKKGEKEERYC